MADIQAFRGLRFDLGKVGALSEVVAPPYDVISAAQQQSLYDLNPHNIIRLILCQDDPDTSKSIYQQAAASLKAWKTEGALKPDGSATIYIYHQKFEFEGVHYQRRGFLSRVKLEPFGSGTIYPHEQTHSKAKEDRYQLMTACNANLSPIFGIYPDAENEAQEILENAIEDKTPLTVEADGVQHQLWQVTNTDAIAAAAKVLGPTPVYIADGHHRYETSCRIMEERKGDAPGEALSSDYTMMMFVSMHDPGLAVLPTHRLFRGAPAISSADLIDKLSECFTCQTFKGAAACQDVWEEIHIEGRQDWIGLYCRQDDTWVLAKLAAEGAVQMEKLAPEQSEQWRSLGVSLLHRLIMEDLLGFGDLSAPKYVHEIGEVVEGIEQGDSAGRDATGQAGTGEPFELVSLVMPATVADVQAISEQGLRMPAKSTYFYPKLLSGLVINPLDG